MNLLDALTFQPPKEEKKVHRNKHKPGTKCAGCENPRHVFKSGRVNTYCLSCHAERERAAYKRRKEEELSKEMNPEYSCSFE